MTRQEHLLTILSEECMEVAQRVSKALRFGLKEIQPGQELTNEERIVYEFNDLFAVMKLIIDEGYISHNTMIEMKQIEEKVKKVEKFLKYSEECGTLDKR